MKSYVRPLVTVGVVCVTVLTVSCTKRVEAMGVSPQALQDRYGIANAYTGQVSTPDGAIRGTIAAVTLPDGRSGQLIIPDSQEYHAAYFQDAQGIHPVELQQGITRAQLVSAPPTVVTRVEHEHAHARRPSWEKDLLVIGGGAGGGALVGGLAGGKKGAAVGIAAGGVGGLIYDLASKKR